MTKKQTSKAKTGPAFQKGTFEYHSRLTKKWKRIYNEHKRKEQFHEKRLVKATTIKEGRDAGRKMLKWRRKADKAISNALEQDRKAKAVIRRQERAKKKKMKKM